MGAVILELARVLGENALVNAQLATYSWVGVGGPADILYIAHSRDNLVQAVSMAQHYAVPWRVYGGLTNVLLPDSGLRGLVILNHLRSYKFVNESQVYVESGAIVVKVAREAVRKGFGGLTWAVGLPGTMGGAIVNNAGAFGGEISRILRQAEVFLPEKGIQAVGPEWFDFSYRNSKLKAAWEKALVLSTCFQLVRRDPANLGAKADEYHQRRHQTQPAGKTLGSTFKNPEGDYAGRLIEAAGLKGTRIGGFVISEKHANFFINDGEGSAADYKELIHLTQKTVSDKFGIYLEPEIEILSDEAKLLASHNVVMKHGR